MNNQLIFFSKNGKTCSSFLSFNIFCFSYSSSPNNYYLWDWKLDYSQPKQDILKSNLGIGDGSDSLLTFYRPHK